MIDPEAQAKLSKYLDPGENLLWAGRPRQGVFASWITIVEAIFMAFLMCGIVWAFNYKFNGALKGSLIFEPKGLAAFLLVFSLFWGGFIALSVGFYRKAISNKEKTCFGVTESRVLKLGVSRGKPALLSMELEKIQHLSFGRDFAGAGNLYFETGGLAKQLDLVKKAFDVQLVFEVIDNPGVVVSIIIGAAGKVGKKRWPDE
ncbi:MAG: hypothetical protein WC889_11065 [Myxococcota bacterium]|jgi:hypothetical protein